MARHRRGRHGPSHRRVVAAGVVIGLVLGCGLIAAAAIPLPSGPPTLSIGVSTSPPAADLVSLPFPAQRQDGQVAESAVAIPTLGVSLVPGTQQPVPIASLTKLMTAYVALHDLPLSPTDTGPSLYVTTADVAEYKADLRKGESSVVVVAGEVLDERQLLDGMLVHSANNFATLLARLVAGGSSEMLVQMNDAAVSLGMTSTSYADVSGFDPSSQSDARDILHLSILLMRDPTFAAIVRQTSVVLPVAGVVTTFTPYLGLPHVVGIKTGTTTAAGGCMVMAYDTLVGGKKIEVIAVVLGQREPFGPYQLLKDAGRAALVLAATTARHVTAWTVTIAGRPVGTLGWPSLSVPVVPTATIVMPTFPGVASSASVALHSWGANAVASGTMVATVFASSGAFRAVSPLVTSGSLARPTLLQRLR